MWDRNLCVFVPGVEFDVVCGRAVNCLVFMYGSKFTWLYYSDRCWLGVWVNGLRVVWGSVGWCFKIIRCRRFTEIGNPSVGFGAVSNSAFLKCSSVL